MAGQNDTETAVRTRRPRAAVIVHSAVQAIAAARAAADAGRPLLIRSAPGAAGYAGCGWFLAILAHARDSVPEADIEGLLDCGDDAAAAIEAMRAGTERIAFHGGERSRANVESIARALGATVEAAAADAADGPSRSRAGDPSGALDLRFAPDAYAACRAFLRGHGL